MEEGFAEIPCPQCAKLLKLPRDLLGKQVKCPSCGMVFVGAESSPPPVREERFSQEPEPWSRAPARESGFDGDRSEMPPADDYDDMDRIRRKRRRDRSNVAGLLTPPAICLIITGVVGLLGNLAELAIAIAMPDALHMQQNPLFQNDLPIGVFFVLGSTFALVNLAIIIGSIGMMRQKYYGMSIATCILAMINFRVCCCLLGMPVGIWALVMLLRPEVKDAFQEAAYSARRGSFEDARGDLPD